MNAIRYPTSTRSTARYARQRRGYPWASCWRPSPPKRQERNERKGEFTMKLYFGNAVTTATTLMILTLLGYIGVSSGTAAISPAGAGERCSCWCSVWSSAALRRRGTGYIKRFRMPLTEAAHRDCFHWSAFPPSSLCRCAADYHCRHCHADCQNAARARDMVLYDVGRRCTENRDDGDRTNHSLKGKGSTF